MQIALGIESVALRTVIPIQFAPGFEILDIGTHWVGAQMGLGRNTFEVPGTAHRDGWNHQCGGQADSRDVTNHSAPRTFRSLVHICGIS